MWTTCGLLWCICQLFGLSFWWHPFTAENPLVSKWCNAKVLQISSDEQTPLHFCPKVSQFSANLHFLCELLLKIKDKYVISNHHKLWLTAHHDFAPLCPHHGHSQTMYIDVHLLNGGYVRVPFILVLHLHCKLGKQPRVIADLWQDVGTRTLKLEADPIKSSVVWVRGHMAGAKSIFGPRDVRTDELLISASAVSAFISPKCASSLTLWPCGWYIDTLLFPKGQ